MVFTLILASLLLLAWLILLFLATDDDWLQATKGHLLANRVRIEVLKRKERADRAKVAQYYGISAKVVALFLDTDVSKQVKKLQDENKTIQGGDLKSVPIWPIPGYVLTRMIPSLMAVGIYQSIRTSYFELHGRKHLELLSRHLYAQLLSYPLIGAGLSMIVGVITALLNDVMVGLAIIVIGTAIVLILVYSIYDNLSDQVKARRESITRQFPNVVSKLALLATSGMIINQAWDKTAASAEGELYLEMRKTAKELNNLVPPDEAYGAFIDRCNTKETTKLASAIMQNQSKGNTEIALLLRQMSEDAWNERRNMAKRDSENANSKMMIPTMLLFVSVLLMLLVPVIMSFSGI